MKTVAHWLRTWPRSKFFITAVAVAVLSNLLEKLFVRGQAWDNFDLFKAGLCVLGLLWGFNHRPKPTDVRKGPWVKS